MNNQNNSQNKNIAIIGGVLAIVLIGGGLAYSSYTNSQKQDDDRTAMVSPTPTSQVMPTKSGSSEQENDSMKKMQGMYVAYEPSKLSMAENGDVVLFFHASWCPTCKATDTDIQNNKEAIPSSLTVLKTDYDSQTELRKKYGVTNQHTFVQVDKDGNQIKKWSGTSTLSDIVSQVQ